MHVQQLSRTCDTRFCSSSATSRLLADNMVHALAAPPWRAQVTYRGAVHVLLVPAIVLLTAMPNHAGPGNYKIPTAQNIPRDFRVRLLENVPNTRAVHSSKAVGEPPFHLGASVLFALKDAIYAARKDAGAHSNPLILCCDGNNPPSSLQACRLQMLVMGGSGDVARPGTLPVSLVGAARHARRLNACILQPSKSS